MKILKYKEYKEIMQQIIEVKEGEEKMRVTSPDTARIALLEYSVKDQEHFVILTLDGSSKIINKHLISIGTVNRTQIHPRDIFRHALKDNATSIILSHNHPSGNLEPSNEDIRITERIKEVGEIMGINVLDHIILSKKGFISFKEKGMGGL